MTVCPFSTSKIVDYMILIRISGLLLLWKKLLYCLVQSFILDSQWNADGINLADAPLDQWKHTNKHGDSIPSKLSCRMSFIHDRFFIFHLSDTLYLYVCSYELSDKYR